MISLDTSLQRGEIAGLITAAVKLLSSTNLNNSFRTPFVSLLVPEFQKAGRELEKNNRIKKDLGFVYIQIGSHII